MAPSPGKLDYLLTCGMTLGVFIYSSSGTFTPLGYYSSFFDCDFSSSYTMPFPSNCSIDSYLHSSYDPSLIFFGDHTASKTIPRVLLVFLILFLKHTQHLSGRCSCLISIGLQVYGILDIMLLMQLDMETSDLYAYCARFILRSIDFIRDDRLRGALICTMIAVYFNSCPSW